ncbi:serine hydrolase [Candidatus Bipolaricaulota bacterium]|nr:serine hydrolase [Candidatus Bipolaricaulota bacterium]
MPAPQRFAKAVERIDRFLIQRHEEGLGPGLSLALTSARELLATRAYGVSNICTQEPVECDTLFQIGSITKPIVASACLRLFEQGKFDLHAPVTEVLDWFVVKSRFASPVTIHHLLTHTSGLVMMIDTTPSSAYQVWSLRTTELGFEPGTKFSYSNVGYNVLQCIIEAITGLKLDNALRALVFEPLGMNSSYGEVRCSEYGRLAKGHMWSPYRDRPAPRSAMPIVANWYEKSEGCASVVTTAADLAAFLRMLLNHGIADDGTAFLQKETFDLMTGSYATMDGFFAGKRQGYGIMTEVSETHDGHRMVLAGGENLGFEAAMYGDLDAGLGVVLFNNSFDMRWIETQFAMKTLGAENGSVSLPEPPLSLDEEPSAETKVDEYADAFAGNSRAFTIRVEDGQLVFATGGQSCTLEKLYGDCFRVPLEGFDHAMLSFGRDQEGRVVEAFQLGEWFPGGRYVGPRSFPYPPTWDAFVGSYSSYAPLVSMFRIFIRKGRLICQSFTGYVDQELTEIGDGRFRSGDETSPETLAFDCIAGARALRCLASGGEYHRLSGS